MKIPAIGWVIQDISSHHNCGKCANHKDFGVSKVDHAQYAIDHGVTQGDQDVDKSLGYARKGQLPELTYEGMQVGLLGKLGK